MEKIEDPQRKSLTSAKNEEMVVEVSQNDEEDKEMTNNWHDSITEEEVELVKLDQSLVSIAARFIFKFSKELNPRSKENFKIKNYSKGRSILISHQNINYYSIKEGPLYAGVAFGVDFKNFLGEKGCRIMSLFIDHMYRRQGYSKILMKFYIQRAKSLGFRRIKLDCYFDNAKAQGLYHKLGFRFCSELYIGRRAVKITNYDDYQDYDEDFSEDGIEMVETRRGEDDLSGHRTFKNHRARRQKNSLNSRSRRESRIIAPGSPEHKDANYRIRKDQSFTNLLKPTEKMLHAKDIILNLIKNNHSSPFQEVLDEKEGTFTGPKSATLYIVDNQDPSKVIGLVGISNMTSPSKNRFIPHVTHFLVDPSIDITDAIVNETVETVLKICLQDWNCYEVLFEVEEQEKMEGYFRIQDRLTNTFGVYKEYCGIYEIDFGAQD